MDNALIIVGIGLIIWIYFNNQTFKNYIDGKVFKKNNNEIKK